MLLRNNAGLRGIKEHKKTPLKTLLHIEEYCIFKGFCLKLLTGIGPVTFSLISLDFTLFIFYLGEFWDKIFILPLFSALL